MRRGHVDVEEVVFAFLSGAVGLVLVSWDSGHCGWLELYEREKMECGW